MTTSALPLILHKNSKYRTWALLASRNPGSCRFLSVGVSGTSSLDEEGLFFAPGLAHPPDPREQPATQDPGRSPTAPAPPLPPHVLTLTLAHPVAARHAWGPPRAHGDEDFGAPLPSFSPLLSSPRFFPFPGAHKPHTWDGPHLSRVRGSYPGLGQPWAPERARPRKASGYAHVPDSGSGRGGPCGRNLTTGRGVLGRPGRGGACGST